MALIRSPSTIFRIGNAGSDVPVLPKGGGKEPVGTSLGRTTAEISKTGKD